MKRNRIKSLICSFLLLTVTTAFSQKNVLQVQSAEKISGRNFIDNSDIKGFEVTFSDRIHKTFLDTATNFLTIQLRGVSKNGKWLNNTGNILQYDIQNNNILWTKKIAYQKNDIRQFGKTIFHQAGNKSRYLDAANGNSLWEVKNDLYFVDHINDVGLGYKNNTLKGRTNELEGIELQNGSIIWKRELNREYGWNNVFFINDSTLIIVASGLHAVNTNTGKGWDYNMITIEKDYTGTAIANTLGIAAGLLTGTFFITTGHSLVTDLISNTLVDSTFIYFASKDQLVKINKQSGEIAWKYPIPKELASKSTLLMNDSTIYMVNKGIAFMGYRQLNFGKPFIAAFDRETGKQKYFSIINVKNDPILNFQVLENEIYLIFKNKISKYNQETGSHIIEKIYSKDNVGELQNIIGKNAFITNKEGDLISLIQNDSTKVYVSTNKNMILSVDNQLNITDTIGYDDIGICYLENKDYKFIAKGGKTLIINPEGEKTAEIDMSSNAFIIEDIIYDTKDKSFTTIDLSEIIN